MRKRLILILLLLFNIYFFSFFIYFKRLPSTYFVDFYKPLPSGGPLGVSVFVPFYATDEINPAGMITHSIVCFYYPMIKIWEKRGVGVFCADLSSVSKLTDKNVNYESQLLPREEENSHE